MNLTQEKKSALLHLLKTKKMFGIEHIKPISFNHDFALSDKLPVDLGCLEEYVSNCALCDLAKSKISFDFAKGNMDSEIIIITLKSVYNNTKEYDDLKLMCEKVLDIDINHIYMTNILKCNVKIEKENLNDEIEKCLNYLKQQIRIIKPSIIITFGDAFKYLTNNNDDILNTSGNLFEYNGIKTFPLLCLDFLIKNPSYKEKMYIDLKKIKKTMDEK